MAHAHLPKIRLSDAQCTALERARIAKMRDQYYTIPVYAEHCFAVLGNYVDLSDKLMVEPSAGQGAFSKLMPPGSIAMDIEPKSPEIIEQDFLQCKLPSDRSCIVLGNPPFGQGAATAKLFFNYAAGHRNVVNIAMILPLSCRKAKIENGLEHTFHLIHEELVPHNAFIFCDEPFDVPAVFQIWERRRTSRDLKSVKTEHPDFEFLPAHLAHLADFAIRRIGGSAGHVHNDLTVSPSSHYFIRGPVQHIMAQLDFAVVAANATGQPSLAKCEIVALYAEWVHMSSTSKVPWRSSYLALPGTANLTRKLHRPWRRRSTTSMMIRRFAMQRI